MRTPLQKGEKVLLITHGSWTILIVPVIITLAGIVASIYIGFINHYGWIAVVLGLLYLLFRYATWNANIWVVTNLRVIDEIGLFSHAGKDSPLDKINNVSYRHSVMGRIFNYGDVEIQTAAQVGATVYFKVNHPRRLKDTITAAQAEYKNWEYSNQAEQMASVLNNAGAGRSAAANVGAELEKLFELKMKGALSEEEYNRAKNKLLND